MAGGERNRTVEDLLKNNKTCPEESIYQIGTLEESVSPETLFRIVNEFYEEFERRFGSHIHILDWALHLDEGTPPSMSIMSLTVRTDTANSAPSRKRRWRNWVSLSHTQTSQKAGATTASRPLMQSAGRFCLTSQSGMACIWNRNRLTAGGSIWKSRIIS